MGFCSDGDDNFDVFLSYSRDDDIAHNHWVSDFEQYLKETVTAELSRKLGDHRDSAKNFKVCRDETGFPVNGVLETVIDDKVHNSQFLIIFLGKGYLNSEWCLSELDVFRATAGGSIQDAAKRLYLIVIDSEVVKRLYEGNVPEHLPKKRKDLWKFLQSLARKSIRIEDFLSDTRLTPVFQEHGKAYDEFHKACNPIVESIVGNLIKCRSEREQQPPPPTAGQRIVVGAVPQRLMPARDQLIQVFRNTGIGTIDAADLGDKDKLRACLKNATMLVQPFDAYQPIMKHDYPPGGHLAFQQQALEEFHGSAAAASDLPLIWWEPQGLVLDVGEPLNFYDQEFINTLPQDKIRHCTVQELVAELCPPDQQSSFIAQVWVEWEESSHDTVDTAKEIIHKFFAKYRDEQEAQGRLLYVTLNFVEVDWTSLEHAIGRKPGGVVIVHNENKDSKAIFEQTETISNLETVLKKKTFPGIFCTLEKGKIRPEGWSFVRFQEQGHELIYETEEVEDFVRNLFDVLWKNRHN